MLLGGTIMRIFKTNFFNRWQNKQSNLDNMLLVNAVKEIQSGLVDAKLGGNLYKKRVAIPGQGKSGSYRVILAHKYDDSSWIFLYGFSKSICDNISHSELVELKALAKDLLRIPIDKLKNILIEIENEK